MVLICHFGTISVSKTSHIRYKIEGVAWVNIKDTHHGLWRHYQKGSI